METEIPQRWEANVLDSDGIRRVQSLLSMIKTTPELALVAGLTYQEVAHLLRVNPRTIRRYVASGQLDAYNLAGKRATPRVRLIDLHEFWQRSPRVTDGR